MTISPRLRLAIVGSGIGGLTLAVALSKLGLDEALEIDIYEAATKLSQVGAGITVWPRAWDILKRLDLEKPLSERSPPKQEMLEGKQVLGFSYRKSDQSQGAPIVDVTLPGGPRAFHRADIQEVLINNASTTVRFHFSHRLVKYTKTADEIKLVFANGDHVTCDLLIGADGVNSAVRKCFLEDGNGDMKHSSPRWSGTNVYRCLIEAEDIRKDAPDHPGLRRPTVYCGKNKHIVVYPILKGRFINTIQFISDPSKAGTILEGPASVNFSEDDVASIYTGWEDDVQHIVKHLKRPSKWAIQTVGPLEKYACDGVILLGDAAHAMPPHLANGAAQAIEDAYILANLLAKGYQEGRHWPNLWKISSAYNSDRQPFGNHVVRAAQQQGRRYEFSTRSFDGVEEGDFIPPHELAELGRSIQKGWEWTWKTSVDEHLERALACI